jgi:hypothetical protein
MDLALSILTAAVGSGQAALWYERFAADVIAREDRGRWWLKVQTIRAYVEALAVERAGTSGIAPCPVPLSGDHPG